MSLYKDINSQINALKDKLGGAYASVIVIMHERQRERERLAMEARIKAKKEADAMIKKAAEEAAEKDRQQRQEAMQKPVIKTSIIMKFATHLTDKDDDEYDDAYLSTAELAEGECRVSDEDWVVVQKPLGR
ncbi:hypothetical protein ACHAQH_005565 [Verticillium albo-atrum]